MNESSSSAAATAVIGGDHSVQSAARFSGRYLHSQTAGVEREAGLGRQHLPAQIRSTAAAWLT
jgi:hypothetical protein